MIISLLYYTINTSYIIFLQTPRSQSVNSPGIQGPNAAASLLQKLISEAESRGVVFSEDLTAPPPQQSLHGVAQSSLDDVILHKWLSKCNLVCYGY